MAGRPLIRVHVVPQFQADSHLLETGRKPGPVTSGPSSGARGSHQRRRAGLFRGTSTRRVADATKLADPGTVGSRFGRAEVAMPILGQCCTASARGSRNGLSRRGGRVPLQVLVDNGEYMLQNKGDLAMIAVTIDRVLEPLAGRSCRGSHLRAQNAAGLPAAPSRSPSAAAAIWRGRLVRSAGQARRPRGG